MATAIPESFTYALQSRLPANSFVVNWKEFRPDQQPINGNSYPISGPDATGSGQRIRLYLRGAPNEFLLNTNTFLVGSSIHQATQVQLNDDDTYVLNGKGLVNLLCSGRQIVCKSPLDYFDGSRESFDSGSLPYHDNQDTVRSHVYNDIRTRCAQRSTGIKQCPEGLFGSSASNLFGRDFESSGSHEESRGLRSGAGIRAAVITSHDGNDANYQIASVGNKKFQIPLGYFSNMINSHSVIPLGLMSSYSVNGYGIELVTTRAPSTTNGWAGSLNPIVQYPRDNISSFNGSSVIKVSATDDEADIDVVSLQIEFSSFAGIMSDIKVYAPVVQILDPAVMDSILSLYQKRETVSMGGITFPLSLRMNSLAYRHSAFPIRSGQSDYHFRIAGTDRSVRGLAYMIYSTQLARDSGIVACGDSLRVTRLETRIGNEHVHEVIEDRDGNTDNVSNFLNVNMRHSAALWSPLPQYLESNLFNGQQIDYGDFINQPISGFGGGSDTQATARLRWDGANLEFSDAIGFSTNPSLAPNGSQKYLQAYGVISFENLDRRERDHAGSYQASGKDLTNVGGIEVDMRINAFRPVALPPATLGDPPAEFNLLDQNTYQAIAPADNNHEIVFSYVYDSIYELSPSGVMDITNAVL